jgi:hypothetical protein
MIHVTRPSSVSVGGTSMESPGMDSVLDERQRDPGPIAEQRALLHEGTSRHTALRATGSTTSYSSGSRSIPRQEGPDPHLEPQGRARQDLTTNLDQRTGLVRFVEHHTSGGEVK